MSSSESEESSFDEESKDWYHDSDTSDNISDPSLSSEPLYQKVGSLPVPLQKNHFEEGLISVLTLKAKQKNPMLFLIISSKRESFVYRVFYVQRSRMKTWHEGVEDKENKYDDVWRLAPRQELMRSIDPGAVYSGQTIRFTYGMDHKHITAFIKSTTSTTIKGKLVCGRNRGKTAVFEQNEVLGCTELFASSSLQDLLRQTKNAT